MVTVVVVEIFTTDGINFSAKSANDPGISFEKEESELLHKNNVDVGQFGSSEKNMNLLTV